MALLEATGLHAQYGWTKVLHGIDFAVQEGGITTILGANGAGKTTTLRAVCGMVRTAGEIRFDGRRINGRATEDLVRLGIGHAPEGRRIFSRLTVVENLQMGGYTRTAAEVREDTERVFGIFPRLRERASQQGGTLSGGEQQMLAIGRALMSRPRVLLLDEPSLGLAPILVQQIFSIIREINELGTTILLVEQNALQALKVAHRGYVLQTGTIILADSAENLGANEQVRQAYLGEI